MSSERTVGATGTIHDQGYQRYEGVRLPRSRRFLVITRNVLATAWKARWGVKLPLLGAVLTLVVSAGIMIVMGQIESRMGGRGGRLLRADTVLFISYGFFSLFGIILAATVATAAIADDLKSGSFQFYFSRPLRPDDYVRGKLLGLFVLIGCSTFAGPVVLSIIRVCLAEDLGGAIKLLPIIPKAILLGVAGTSALVLPAIGLGALLGKRVAAQAAFIVYWIVISGFVSVVAHELRLPLVGLLALNSDVNVVGGYLFGMPSDSGSPEPWQAGLAIVVFSVAGYVALRRRIRSSATAGLGGV